MLTPSAGHFPLTIPDRVAGELPDSTILHVESAGSDIGLGTFQTLRDRTRGRKTLCNVRGATSKLYIDDWDATISTSSLTTQNFCEHNYRKELAVTTNSASALAPWKTLLVTLKPTLLPPPGHDGCVNRLCWNHEGSSLASVSDDGHFCLWDTYAISASNIAESKPTSNVVTGHNGNIFGVCFVNDNDIATGGMDGVVQLTHIAPNGQSTTKGKYVCHSNRVKQLVSVSRSVWLSCSEDGTIRQFDDRAPHLCSSTGCYNVCDILCRVSVSSHRLLHQCCSYYFLYDQAIITLSGAKHRLQQSRFQTPQSTNASEPFWESSKLWLTQHRQLMSVAVHPIRQHYILVAAHDPIVRLYDCRMLSITAGVYSNTTSSCPSSSECCEAYCPVNLWKTPLYRESLSPGHGTGLYHPTYITWRPDGKEFIVNYSREDVYVFPFGACRTDDTEGLKLKVQEHCVSSTLSMSERDMSLSSSPSNNMTTKDLTVLSDQQQDSLNKPVLSAPPLVLESSSTLNNETEHDLNEDLRNSIYPASISDALYTFCPNDIQPHHNDDIQQDPEFSFVGPTDHPLYSAIQKAQLLGNQYMAETYYHDAVIAYTAALRLCGPPWPVQLEEMTPVDTITMLNNDDHDLHESSTTPTESIPPASSTFPLLSVDPCVANAQAETDAIEALTYNPSHGKAVYRYHYMLIQAQIAQGHRTKQFTSSLIGLRRALLSMDFYPDTPALQILCRQAAEQFQIFQSFGEILPTPSRDSRPQEITEAWSRCRRIVESIFRRRGRKMPLALSLHPIFYHCYFQLPIQPSKRRKLIRRLHPSLEYFRRIISRPPLTPPPTVLESIMTDDVESIGAADDALRVRPSSDRTTHSRPLPSEDNYDDVNLDEIEVDEEDERFYYSLRTRYETEEKLSDWQPRGIADRFCGRWNDITDIQEANFWGCSAIVSGCNSSRVLVWRRSDGALINMLNHPHRLGVNCVQVHPELPILATSGLDDEIVLWKEGPQTMVPTVVDTRKYNSTQSGIDHISARQNLYVKLHNQDPPLSSSPCYSILEYIASDM